MTSFKRTLDFGLRLGGQDEFELIEQVGEAVDEALRPLLALDGSTLRTQRREKFLAMGGRGL